MVFELGAHQGLIAMMFAATVGSKGRIIAVEADPRNEAIAKRNYLLNNMNSIRSENRAVADTDGFIEIEVHDQASLSNSRPSLHTIRIPSVTIDSLRKKHGEPSLVMLDIEGAEMLALTGAGKTLQGTSDFTVEIHAGCGLEKLGGNVTSIINTFRSHGYDLYYRFEQDPEYRSLNDAAPESRFFLIALNPRKEIPHI